jgi:tripartite-type tricarboxylate transporter receptor subunit TctC
MKQPGFAILLGAAALAIAWNGAASAQSYPAKPIRFIVPFSPGGGADATARLFAPAFGERLGQQVIVDNRGGAGGTIGAALGARTPPDGYTLVLGSTNIAAAPALMGKLPFDPVKDFTAVSLLVKTPSVLAVHPSVPAKSVKELIALARSKPGMLNYAGGVGTTLHLGAELFKAMAKVDITQVPYNGTGPAVIAALSGEASVILAPTLSLLPHIQSRRLRALGITSAQRSPELPDIPAIAETVPGFETTQWYGILVPAGTPEPIVSRLNAEAVRVAQSPEFRDRMKKDASIALGTSGPEFAAFFREETQKWIKVIKVSGASAT